MSKEIAREKLVIQQITEELTLHGKQSSEIQMMERNIQDNLKHRELLKRGQDLESRVSALKSRLGSFDRSNSMIQLNRQQLRRSDLMGERSGLLGEIKQLEDQLVRLHRELELDYLNVESNYREQFIRTSAMMVGIDDLEKYGKALDQAIMKYHSYKMDEINKIIREIWTNTYQGAGTMMFLLYHL
jgi:DNA repair protein RAD50